MAILDDQEYLFRKRSPMRSQKHSDLRCAFENISRLSMTVFHIGAPLIFLYLCAFLSLLFASPDIPGYVLASIHKGALEHIIMSATLITVGGFFFDIVEKSSPPPSG